MFFDVRFFVHIQGVALGPLIEAPIKIDPLREKHAMNIHVCQVERNQQLYTTDCFMWTSTNQRGVVFQVFAGCDVVYLCIYLYYFFAACERLPARRVSSHCEAHAESGLTSVLYGDTRPC